jgi:hypothetical protein
MNKVLSENLVFNQRACSILFDYFYFLKNSSKTVVFPANICPVVLAVAFKSKVKFEIRDVNQNTMCLDFENIETDLLTKDCILFYVCMYGNDIFNISKFRYYNKKYGVRFVLDKCLCFPEFSKLEDFVDLKLFSTYEGKPLTLKMGGLALVRSEFKPLFGLHKLEYEPSADINLSVFLKKDHLEIALFKILSDSHWLKYSSCNNPIVEYLSIVKQELPDVMLYKNKIHNIYKDLINLRGVTIKKFYSWRTILVFDKMEDRDKAYEEIFNAGYFASKHYKSLQYLDGKEDKSIAKDLSEKVLNLFNCKVVSPYGAIQISKIINKVYL